MNSYNCRSTNEIQFQRVNSESNICDRDEVHSQKKHIVHPGKDTFRCDLEHVINLICICIHQVMQFATQRERKMKNETI